MPSAPRTQPQLTRALRHVLPGAAAVLGGLFWIGAHVPQVAKVRPMSVQNRLYQLRDGQRRPGNASTRLACNDVTRERKKSTGQSRAATSMNVEAVRMKLMI